MKTWKGKIEEKLLTPQELADELSVGKKWVLDKTREKKIPAAFRCGNVIRYRLSDVLRERGDLVT